VAPEPEGSSPYSPYPEPTGSNLPKIHSDPILPPTTWSFTWSLFFWLTQKVSLWDYIPVCLRLPPPHKLLNQLIEFYEIQYERHATEGDVNNIMTVSTTASTTQKWQMFKPLMWMQNLHQWTWNHGILYDDISSKQKPKIRTWWAAES
jgi:hypothetical protein